jgi:hypothetical protein
LLKKQKKRQKMQIIILNVISQLPVDAKITNLELQIVRDEKGNVIGCREFIDANREASQDPLQYGGHGI